MEIKRINIGPLVCKCCGKITAHAITFNYIWMAPVILDKVIHKSKLLCLHCNNEYKLTNEAKIQAKLFDLNFGKDRTKLIAFEELLMNVIKQYEVYQNGLLQLDNLNKAVEYMCENHSTTHRFSKDFYERYIRIMQHSFLLRHDLENKYFI